MAIIKRYSTCAEIQPTREWTNPFVGNKRGCLKAEKQLASDLKFLKWSQSKKKIEYCVPVMNFKALKTIFLKLQIQLVSLIINFNEFIIIKVCFNWISMVFNPGVKL